mmetsp:Transcript_58149/g.173534  ORF Transcript_58149/g.173534 Transcript_58149/m.173534 type:complete len:155 (-) Transcript_58149:99-563(-)
MFDCFASTMKIALVFNAVLAVPTKAFVPSRSFARKITSALNMQSITEGVDFDTIAREWRCKWSGDDDKSSLAAAQVALDTVLPELNELDGIKSVERIVCGGCLDLKVVTSLPAGEKFVAWEKAGFPPEEDFLDMLRSIDGISQIETQTYTRMVL